MPHASELGAHACYTASYRAVNNLHLFAGGTYGATGLAIAAAFSAVSVFVLGVAIGIRGRGAAGALLFFGITTAASGWLASFAIMYTSQRPETAIAWARAGNFFAALIAPAIFHFAAVYVGRGRQLRNVLAASWAICVILGALSATHLLIPAVQRFWWGFYPKPSLYLAPAVLIYLGIIANGIRLLLFARRASEGRQLRNVLAASWAICVILGALSATHLLIPAVQRNQK